MHEIIHAGLAGLLETSVFDRVIGETANYQSRGEAAVAFAQLADDPLHIIVRVCAWENLGLEARCEQHFDLLANDIVASSDVVGHAAPRQLSLAELRQILQSLHHQCGSTGTASSGKSHHLRCTR